MRVCVLLSVCAAAAAVVPSVAAWTRTHDDSSRLNSLFDNEDDASLSMNDDGADAMNEFMLENAGAYNSNNAAEAAIDDDSSNDDDSFFSTLTELKNMAPEFEDNQQQYNDAFDSEENDDSAFTNQLQAKTKLVQKQTNEAHAVHIEATAEVLKKKINDELIQLCPNNPVGLWVKTNILIAMLPILQSGPAFRTTRRQVRRALAHLETDLRDGQLGNKSPPAKNGPFTKQSYLDQLASTRAALQGLKAKQPYTLVQMIFVTALKNWPAALITPAHYAKAQQTLHHIEEDSVSGDLGLKTEDPNPIKK